jgi:glycosyltransferase involved in cell wall biosynthesis
MSQPLVSIIIPAWNHLPELLECLKSIATQTYRNLEVIVVDDASTDGTGERMSQYQAPFPLKIHLLPVNRGAAAARNEGARLATGEGYLFVDADAVLRPDAIEKMVEVLQKDHTAAFAYSSFRFGWKKFKSRAFDADTLRRGPYIHTTALMRRAAFTGFDESLKKFQDWDLWLTIVERGGKGVWIPEELFTIKTRAEGMSRWLPSFAHRLPWPIFGWMPNEITRYREWEAVIKQKHHIA